MRYFVDLQSPVRRIWSNSDSILLIFAGSAAEFALNRAVDWLFFTGALPQNPIGRLFSTTRFAQDIVFADELTAQHTLERINTIHAAVERQRGAKIPEWSHRDVLFMLLDYSARAHEFAFRPLTETERDEHFHVFRRIGEGLGVADLPQTYAQYQIARQQHLEADLEYSPHTAALYAQYRRHLGPWRYDLLLQIQALLVPEHVRNLLQLKPSLKLERTRRTYQLVERLHLRPLVQRLLLPPQYLAEVRGLDRAQAA